MVEFSVYLDRFVFVMNSHTFVDKLVIFGAMYLANLSMKTFFKRNASIGLSTISAKGGNLYLCGRLHA